MKSRLGEMARALTNQAAPVSFSVELCATCRREVLPARRRPGVVRDMHRAPAKGMAQAPDPKAEKIRRRKSRKRSLRSVTREIGIVGAIVLSLDARQLGGLGQPMAVDENCQRCLRRRRVA